MKNISVVLSLTIASGCSLIGQLCSHLLTYADGYAPALRFFTAPALILGLLFILSLAALIRATVQHAKSPGITVTSQTTYLLLALFIVLLNVLAVLPLADPGWWLLGFLAMGVPGVVIASLLAFPITAFTIWRVRHP